jgi:hypothetical protein
MRKLTITLALLITFATLTPIFAGTSITRNFKYAMSFKHEGGSLEKDPYLWVEHGSLFMDENNIVLVFMNKDFSKTETVSEYKITKHKEKSEATIVFNAEFDNGENTIVAQEGQEMYTGSEGYYVVGDKSLMFYPNHGDFYLIINLK